MSMEYPKIETLFNRDEAFKVIESEYRLPEFKMLKDLEWYVTEKVDGTNVRISLEPRSYTDDNDVNHEKYDIIFMGRTDKAEFHPNLIKYLGETFTEEKIATVFPPNKDGSLPHIILYGEGYGPKIQSGGAYRKDIAVRLFDIFVSDPENPLGGWWLEPENIAGIASKLGVNTMPELPMTSIPEITNAVEKGFNSWVAIDDGTTMETAPQAEGIVARTKPLLFTRKGERIIWKLKTKDFNSQKKVKTQ